MQSGIWSESHTTRGNQTHFNFDPTEITPAELLAEISQRLDVRDLLIENPPIDEVISKLYGELKI